MVDGEHVTRSENISMFVDGSVEISTNLAKDQGNLVIATHDLDSSVCFAINLFVVWFMILNFL